jgi:hypothetical protein
MIMKRLSSIAMALLAAATPAFAQTVNDYTPAEQARAEAAIRAAGFLPRGVVMAQDHNLFFKGEKDGKLYFMTVTPQGNVYPGLPYSAPGA